LFNESVNDNTVVTSSKAIEKNSPVRAFADRQRGLVILMNGATDEVTVIGRAQRDALRLKPLDEFVEHFSHAALLDTRSPQKGMAGERCVSGRASAADFSAVR
jgi:hypothetical protein